MVFIVLYDQYLCVLVGSDCPVEVSADALMPQDTGVTVTGHVLHVLAGHLVYSGR